MNAWQDVINAFFAADQEWRQILILTLKMTALSTFLAASAGLPAGVALASCRFPGRRLLRRLMQTFMGLPPVVAGLVVFLILSHKGPLGSLNLLFSLPAMVIAQFILIFPIIASLTATAVEARQLQIQETLRGLGVSRPTEFRLLLWECRFALVTVLLTGFGRSISEVGAVMMVGGNIQYKTRVMTTAIMLETNKGNFETAIILGAILLLIAFVVNLLTIRLEERQHV